MTGLKNENRGVKIAAHVVLIFLTICALAPFLLLISSSLTSSNALATYGYGFLPRQFSLEAYSYIFNAWNIIGRAYLVTIFVTVVGVTLSLLISSMFAYVLARYNNIFTKIIRFLLVFSLLFSGGIVASYVIWTNIFSIQNTIFALILPGHLMNGFTVILIISYFKNTLSKDFADAAEIDGAGSFRIYWNIYIPLSGPILATVGMMSAIGYWNDYTNGMYYITNPNLYSIQQFLKEVNDSIAFLANNPDANLAGVEIPSASVRMAIAVVGILPLLIAYPFFQKYFTAGITLGGVKG